MKFLQKRWVAVTLCIVMIVAAIGIGQAKANWNSYKPDSTAAAEEWGQENYAAYTRFLRDDAGLLSSSTEKTLCAYNGALDYSYESICGVATVSSLNGQDMEDMAYDMAGELGLGESDCLLLVDGETQEWYFVYGNEFGYYVNNELEILFRGELGDAVKDPDRQLPALFEELSDWYQETLPVSGQAAESDHNGLVAGGAVFFVFLIVLLIIVAVISAIVRASRRMVGGFRTWFPMFFFGPGPRGPRPPFGPGPRPGPGSNPGPRPGSSNNNRSSGGFGSSSRGSSFGSGSRSGGFGSSSRGSSGGSRGGGFGGGKR